MIYFSLFLPFAEKILDPVYTPVRLAFVDLLPALNVSPFGVRNSESSDLAAL